MSGRGAVWGRGMVRRQRRGAVWSAPISASMKALTWSMLRFIVLQMSPKLMKTTRFEPSRTTWLG